MASDRHRAVSAKQGTLKGFGAAVQFADMSSPTLHAWSCDVGLFPPLSELQTAELGGYPFGPTTALARVAVRLATVLAMVLHEDRGGYPGMETSLHPLDPAYEFSDRTTQGRRDVQVRLGGVMFALRRSVPSREQRSIPL